MAFNTVHVVINPAAGQPAPLLHAINHVLHPHDIAWDVSITSGGDSGARLARRAVEAGADVVVACGGDGTVKDVINGLVGSDVPLAILPGGTGNALAYEFDIPPKLSQAAALITSDHRLRAVDLGRATADNQEAYFMLRASIGLQSQIVGSALPEDKRRFGNLAYVIASLQSLAGSQVVSYEITVDGQAASGDGLSCLVTNSASVGGRNSFRFAAGVDPSDGLLDVFVLDASFASIVSVMTSALDAPLGEFPQHWHGKSVTVTTAAPQAVTLDGEPFAETPVEVAVVPEAVRVIVPPPDREEYP
jgi:diacylglycerol kinase (ATP)